MKKYTRRVLVPGILALAAVGLSVSACSTSAATADPSTVTLVTHDSFHVDPAVLAAFEEESGYTVNQVAPGDTGILVNQLVLTRDHPLGDAVYGIDNAFAGRAISEGVLEPYTPAGLSDSARKYAIGDGGELSAVDLGDVCVNVDHEWFESHGVAEPTDLDDLTSPQYRDLLVVENPATSSPGLSFLLATVGAYGPDGWQEYWTKLAANGVMIEESWTDAYGVDFSGGEGSGPRPLVVSYSTSPAFTVNEEGTASRTGVLPDTCFRQVEYAGVLHGAGNPAGARALVDFLVSAAFQGDIPGSMYMYPADSSVALPDGWAQFAPLAVSPHDVPADQIDAHRQEWIEQWTTAVIG